MDVEIVPVTRGNLDLVAKGGHKFGMPRSVRWYERCLYDPTVKDLVDSDIRGHMAIKDGKEVVAIQCYFYIPGYFRQKKILMSSGCIMGADAKYGEELICCLDKNSITQNPGLLGVGNCIANKRSAKICKVYHKMKEAPLESRKTYLAIVDWAFYFRHVLRKYVHCPLCCLKALWYITRPISWFVNVGMKLVTALRGFRIVLYRKIDKDKFGKFWKARLLENNGVITSRAPDRLAWMFDDSLAAGMVQVITVEKRGEIKGYALIRRSPRSEGFFNNHSLYDIIALNDDKKTLQILVQGAMEAARKDRGSLLMYIGALPKQRSWLSPFFSKCVKTDFSTFFYVPMNNEIKDSLAKEEGWFFGPMDGERCLGCGGYIDT